MKTRSTPKDHLPAELAANLDPIFASGAPEQAQQGALERLHDSLAAASNQLYFYTQFEHRLTDAIFAMVHQGRLVAVDLGISPETFLARAEQRFGEQPYLAPERLAHVEQQLHEYLDGRRLEFEIETDLGLLTEFQRQVLAATSQIPRGTVVTYLDIARKIGKPKAVRAVGQALGRNPVPIVIPCHRVIAANGSLGGYSGGGGLVTKTRLLQLEGAMLA